MLYECHHTWRSSQIAPHFTAMHGSLRLFPSLICTLKCCCQQSLQYVWPHSMVVAVATGTSQKQHPHSISPDIGTAWQSVQPQQQEIRSATHSYKGHTCNGQLFNKSKAVPSGVSASDREVTPADRYTASSFLSASVPAQTAVRNIQEDNQLM